MTKLKSCSGCYKEMEDNLKNFYKGVGYCKQCSSLTKELKEKGEKYPVLQKYWNMQASEIYSLLFYKQRVHFIRKHIEELENTRLSTLDTVYKEALIETRQYWKQELEKAREKVKDFENNKLIPQTFKNETI